MEYDYYYTDDIEREMKNLQNGNGRPANVGLAIAALIMGIISVVFFLFVLNIITAIIAIIMAIVFLVGSRRGDKGRSMAVAGIITSVLSIVLCVGSYALVIQNADNIGRMMQKELQNNNSIFRSYENDIEDPFKDFDGNDDFNDFEEFYKDFNNGNGNDSLDDFLKEKDDTL